MKRRHKRMIHECLRNFDFKKVEQVMEFLKWEWVSSGGVPNANEIEDEAERLLKACIKEDLDYLGGGGLWVHRWYGNLQLSFSIEDWEAEK